MKDLIAIVEHKNIFQDIIEFLHPEPAIDYGESIEDALKILQEKRRDFIFIDIHILAKATKKNGEYGEVFDRFWQYYPTLEIIVLAPQERIRDAVMAVKGGASNYLTYPFDPLEVNYVMESSYEAAIMQSELDYLRDQFWQEDASELIKTMSPLMRIIFDKVKAVAPTKSTVLLSGETGTGKGVIAKLIHQHSNRCDAQFISVHCGAIPDTLLESELFGYEKGAFTGAAKRKLGKFEIAQNGTIFLDEIGTVTPAFQVKLLQVLQEKTFSRVGGEDVLETNARIIVATNDDLKKMCDEGLFRRDLYYRLNVFPIEIPPVKERKEDIPLLCANILNRLNKYYQKNIRGFRPDVLKAMQEYYWPGNIREMENILERAYILENNAMLTRASFPGELFQQQELYPAVDIDTSLSLAEVRRRSTDHVEKKFLLQVLAEKKGRIKHSAEAAGITTRQLHKLMKKHHLCKEDFKG